ncbi:MAG: hypothetical protein WCA84_18495 [Ignavibacteriaceae bacterium]
MKKGQTVILLILSVFIATVLATGTITLNAGSNGNLSWSVTQDVPLSSQDNFIIQRQTTTTPFKNVGSVPAQSNVYSYQWTDPIYKTADVFYIYQVQLIDASGNVLATSKSYGSDISGVKQTWGSIKAMFR